MQKQQTAYTVKSLFLPQRLSTVVYAASNEQYQTSYYQYYNHSHLSRDHVTPLLRELHWLRIPERITFKLSCLVLTAQHLCTSPTASTVQLTSSRGGVCVPVHQRRSLFQWLVAARSGIALSRLLLPVHGAVYHRLSRHRRHCRLLSVIWRRICSQHRICDADSSCFPVFCLPNVLTIVILLRVLGVYFRLGPKCHANLFVHK